MATIQPALATLLAQMLDTYADKPSHTINPATSTDSAPTTRAANCGLTINRLGGDAMAGESMKVGAEDAIRWG